MYALLNVKRVEVPIEIMISVSRYTVRTIKNYSQADLRILGSGVVVEEPGLTRRGRGGYEGHGHVTRIWVSPSPFTRRTRSSRSLWIALRLILPTIVTFRLPAFVFFILLQLCDHLPN